MENNKSKKLIPFKVLETSETAYEIPQGVSMIKAPEFWEKGNKGKDITIAIIDSGCDCNHSDLKDRIIGKKNFTTDDNGDENNVTDYVGHGTHVAGTIAASENGKGVIGVAPEANLLILKALDKDGRGYNEWIINAINYAISKEVDIISMSLGGSDDDQNLHEAIKNAVNNNILVVCAAGNEGDDNPDTDEFGYPGAYNESISVGAIDYTRRYAKFTNSNKEVDLVAPGVNIKSTYPNNKYATLSGTSMATPHISGALALIKNWANNEFGRSLTEPELYAQLIKETISLGYKRTLVGNGMLYLTAQQILEEHLKKISVNSLDDISNKTEETLSTSQQELKNILEELKLNQEKIKEDINNYYDENKDKENVKTYYESIDFNNKENLVKNIQNLISKTHKPVKYNPSQYLYKWIDLQPDGKLKSIYCGTSKEVSQVIEEDYKAMMEINKHLNNINAKYIDDVEKRELEIAKAYDKYRLNCEHSVPQSWFNKKEPMKADLHHLFTCEANCNSFRSDYSYYDFKDYTPDAEYEILKEIVKNECGKVSTTKKLFEPEYGKGIVARATLYFLLRYPGKISENNVDRDLMIQWHKEFPVSVYEKHRNNAIYETQGNRNPFIDFPEIDFI